MSTEHSNDDTAEKKPDLTGNSLTEEVQSVGGAVFPPGVEILRSGGYTSKTRITQVENELKRLRNALFDLAQATGHSDMQYVTPDRDCGTCVSKANGSTHQCMGCCARSKWEARKEGDDHA